MRAAIEILNTLGTYVEQRANAFAVAFLAPLDAVRNREPMPAPGRPNLRGVYISRYAAFRYESDLGSIPSG